MDGGGCGDQAVLVPPKEIRIIITDSISTYQRRSYAEEACLHKTASAAGEGVAAYDLYQYVINDYTSNLLHGKDSLLVKGCIAFGYFALLGPVDHFQDVCPIICSILCACLRSCCNSVSLSAEFSKSLCPLEGPMEGTDEHKDLESKVGFGCRQVLGEIICACVVCRVDVGYAATFLSRFAQAPAKEHYKAFKDVVKYLRRTKDWGIACWREHPLESLPHAPLPGVKPDTSLPSFPVHEPLQLAGYLDAAHATDLRTCHSVTGCVFTLAGGAVAFKSKLQPAVATSSTKAKLIASVSVGKVAKHLCSVLCELGFAHLQPTPLCADNQAAIAVVNERKPTPRSRHIDIQHFAIQEWQAAGDIVMHHIPGVINPSDQAAKALGWALHSRHIRRSMGHRRPC